ncbi:MAG: hypothetical protein H6739_05435 [Alphaproteobacteria bacterium]|nr:hypothetical protein [Alphaproteobacteria bacterium]
MTLGSHRWSRGAVALTLIAACAGPGDAERYRRVVNMQPVDLEPALALCAGISDPGGAAECAMVAAVGAARDQGVDPETWCDRVPEGPWRNECRFQAAEVWRGRGDVKRATALCLQAGPFISDCAQHLWQDELRGLIFERGPAGFAEQLPRAEVLSLRWRALLGDQTDLGDRFWRRYYENGFEAERHLDLSACDAVEGQGRLVQDHVERCRHAGAHLLQRRIGRVADDPALREVLCAMPAADCASAAVIPQLSCAPDPLLEAVLAEQLDWRCIRGRDGPAPDQGTIRYLSGDGSPG